MAAVSLLLPFTGPVSVVSKLHPGPSLTDVVPVATL